MISSCVKSSTRQRLVGVCARRTSLTRISREAGSKCRFLTTKTPQKPPQHASPVSSSPKNPTPKPPTTTSGGTTINPNEMSNPPDVTLEVTPEMKMANLALAAVLVGFVTGVWYYSMSAVGSQEKGGDDPLAQLKLEAQEALDRQEKENTPDQRAQQLLQEFNRGEHDPDKGELDALEELEKMEQEDEAAKKKKKKSWWKFW